MAYGIPTLYRNVQYRSRLEAKWAAFFDLVGWPFQYEPFDLDGWIPDFLLMGEVPSLVEVKPTATRPEATIEKIGLKGDDYEVLIVGCVLCAGDDADLRLGWQRDIIDGRAWWNEAALMTVPGGWDWCSAVMSWHGRMTGHYDGHLSLGDAGFDTAISKWHLAGNTVQWKAARPEPHQVDFEAAVQRLQRRRSEAR